MRLVFALLAASGLLLAALLLIGTLSRYFDLRFLFGTDEISILVAIWFYFLGVAAASRRQSHIEGGLVQVVKSERLRQALQLVKLLVSVAVLSILAYGSVAYVVELVETGRRSSYFQLPSYLWALAVAAGLTASAGFYALHLLNFLRRRGAPPAAAP